MANLPEFDIVLEQSNTGWHAEVRSVGKNTILHTAFGKTKFEARMNAHSWIRSW